MSKIIKILIQENGYPLWYKGEVTKEEIDKIILLLKTMRELRE